MRLRLGVVASFLVALPAPAHAQFSHDEFHATLRGWAESVWLHALDRRSAAGGRVSENGILERFNEVIDDKYFLDRLTAAFTPIEDYEWYARESGVRWSGGSITKRSLAVDLELKATVPLGEKWGFGVRVNKTEFPEVNHTTFRFRLARSLSSRLTVFAESFLDPQKPGSDVEAGIRWRSPSDARVEATIGVLDFPNDFIYLNLNAQRQTGVDSTLEYERQPITVRTSFSVPLTSSFRLEGHGAVARPSTILAYEGKDESAGFRQHERFAFAGALLEWVPRPGLMAAAFVNTVYARSIRSPLSAAAPVASYRLTEQTTEIGIVGAVRLAPRWRVDFWARHSWRPERRVFLAGEDADVDFMLRSFNSQAVLTYRARSGFVADLGVGYNNAQTPRGDGQVPSTGSLKGIQYRIRYDAGWRIHDRFSVLVGSATDIDGESGEGVSFGGARGRFVMYW